MQKYQVLARRYRPQRFLDVVGQEAAVTTLKNSVRLDKVAHAYLFCGSRGVGKTTLARIFAKALNCSQRGPDCEPCGQCPSCLEISSGQSLDVIEIDGASNRGIDDIRQINETIGYAPSSGKFKIYIIDEVHMLTKEAFNALLKTLEEPPERAKFLFATTEPHKVLPTILSRCQRYDLSRIPLLQITYKLEKIAGDLNRLVDPEALHLIATYSDGSLRDAESLLDQIFCFSEGTITADAVRQALGLVPQEYFFTLDQAFSEAKAAYAFELVEHLFQTGKDLGHFFEQLIEHYRLLAVLKTTGEKGIALPDELLADYLRASRLYSGPQALYLLDYLLQAEIQFHRSLVPRVFLESTLLHVIRSKHRIPVEVLVRRLSEIEQSLAAKQSSSPPPSEPIPEPEPETQPEPSEPRLPPPTLKPAPLKPNLVKSSPAETQPRQTAPSLKQTPQTPETAKSSPRPIPESSESPLASPTLKPVPFSPQTAKPSSTPVIPNVSAQVSPPITAAKHPSHYDTLMRFAAIELEGNLNLNHSI